ncbi:MAG: sugar phosphate nucleotidyltransferase [Eubacteriales bacterium]|jgi:UTP-glucose-1-phosphate uridylyltransferase
MKKTTLAVMAAGDGSRYGGGIRQMEPLGPGGEPLLAYSVYDALEAGFDRVVFIISKTIDKEFRERIGSRIAAVAEVAYAYQELDGLPAGFSAPEGRRRPWGTGQAVLAAADVLTDPFAVINADDYYGKKGFRMLHDDLVRDEEADDMEHVSLVSFALEHTLSDNGSVTRGILSFDESGNVTGIHETKNLIRTEDGAAVMSDEGILPVRADCLVSMNLWGFRPSVFGPLEEGFRKFLADPGEDAMKAEYLLPDAVDSMLKRRQAAVHVLRSDDVWFGVTYREDRETARDMLSRLTEEGVYRTPLFTV